MAKKNMTRHRNTKSYLGPTEKKTKTVQQQQEPAREHRQKFTLLTRLPLFLFYVLPLIALGDLLFSSGYDTFEVLPPTVAPMEITHPPKPSPVLTPLPTFKTGYFSTALPRAKTPEPTSAGTSSGTSSGSTSDTEDKDKNEAPIKSKTKPARLGPSGPQTRAEDGKTSNQEMG